MSGCISLFGMVHQLGSSQCQIVFLEFVLACTFVSQINQPLKTLPLGSVQPMCLGHNNDCLVCMTKSCCINSVNIEGFILCIITICSEVRRHFFNNGMHDLLVTDINNKVGCHFVHLIMMQDDFGCSERPLTNKGIRSQLYN